MGVNFVLTFVFVTVSYINAQQYVMLDETDFNEWDPNEQNSIFLDQRDHVIHRREAVDTDLEGSGEGVLPIPLLEEPSNKTSTVDIVAAPPQDNPEEQKPEKEGAGIQISNFGEINPVVESEETPKSNETKTESEQPIVDVAGLETAENKTEQKTTNQPEQVPKTAVSGTNQSENDPEKLVNASATETPEIVSKEQPVLPPLVHSVLNETTEVPEQHGTIPLAPITDIPSVLGKEGDTAFSSSSNKSKDASKEEQEKVTPQVLPSDLAEVENINKTKESESVNEQQSGNAVMLKVPKTDGGSQVEGSESEKALQGMAENAKISNEPTEQPATGESAKNVSRAGKDTTILVVLFVVVIAIGGAAFTHNYIKKRKQNAATNNDIVNGIRRSLQNLSSSNVKNNPDVEQGTELKPLMKENSPITVTKDYTDTKKEVQA